MLGDGTRHLIATDPAFVPARTELGEILRRLRRASLAAGVRLLSPAEIDDLMDRLRGRRAGRGER